MTTQDKPFPVSAKARKTLTAIAERPRTIAYAPVQIERLRRSGYVRVLGVLNEVYVTDAGRALLAGRSEAR